MAKQTGAQRDNLLVGWSRVDITPDKPVQLRGQFHERIGHFVRDPVTATALALEGQDAAGNPDQAIAISCDLVGLADDTTGQVREMIAAQLPDFDGCKLFISATHTHTAPTSVDGWYPPSPTGVMLPTDYAEFLTRRLAEVAVKAWTARRPMGVSWALGRAAIGHNRRIVLADGRAQMYGDSNTSQFIELEGAQDTGVELLYTWEGEQLRGMVINLGCTPQTVGHHDFVSADFWGEARAILRREQGHDLFVLPWTGATGDQCPVDLVRRGRAERFVWNERGLPIMGRRIARAAGRALIEARTQVHTEIVFKHLVAEWALPVRQVTAGEAQAAQEELDRLLSQSNWDPEADTWRLWRYRRILQRYAEQKAQPTCTVEVHVLRLGEIAIATNPFELYLDYGFQIKARSRARQTFLVELCGDSAGYLPTTKAVPAGGYSAEAIDNQVGPEGGDLLVERTLELINGLWAEEGG